MVSVWVWTHTDEESSLEITSSPLVPSISYSTVSPLVPSISYSTVCEPFFGSFSLIIVCSYSSGIQRDWKLWLILENHCVVVSTAKSRSHDSKVKSNLLWERVNPISTQIMQKSQVQVLLQYLVHHVCVYLRDESLVKGKIPDTVWHVAGCLISSSATSSASFFYSYSHHVPTST